MFYKRAKEPVSSGWFWRLSRYNGTPGGGREALKARQSTCKFRQHTKIYMSKSGNIH